MRYLSTLTKSYYVNLRSKSEKKEKRQGLVQWKEVVKNV